MGHRYWFAYPFPASQMRVPIESLAPGQLISSAEDMSHYLIAQLSEGRYGAAQILSACGIDEMHRPAANVSMMGEPMGQYAMGWFFEGNSQQKALWHSGIVPDFMSYMAILPKERKGFILLANANNAVMNEALVEVRAGVRSLLAGEPPSPPRFGFLTWVQRGLLLIPLMQIVGVLLTLRTLRRWQRNRGNLPSRTRKWMLHILLPIIPNLLLGLMLLPFASRIGIFFQLHARFFVDRRGLRQLRPDLDVSAHHPNLPLLCFPSRRRLSAWNYDGRLNGGPLPRPHRSFRHLDLILDSNSAWKHSAFEASESITACAAWHVKGA
jgi:hypothetical protein